jgi:hypothetical protein
MVNVVVVLAMVYDSSYRSLLLSINNRIIAEKWEIFNSFRPSVVMDYLVVREQRVPSAGSGLPEKAGYISSPC